MKKYLPSKSSQDFVETDVDGDRRFDADETSQKNISHGFSTVLSIFQIQD